MWIGDGWWLTDGSGSELVHDMWWLMMIQNGLWCVAEASATHSGFPTVDEAAKKGEKGEKAIAASKGGLLRLTVSSGLRNPWD